MTENTYSSILPKKEEQQEQKQQQYVSTLDEGDFLISKNVIEFKNIKFNITITQSHIIIENSEFNLRFIDYIKNGIYDTTIPIEFYITMLKSIVCDHRKIDNIDLKFSNDFQTLKIKVNICDIKFSRKYYEITIRDSYQTTNNLIQQIQPFDHNREGLQYVDVLNLSKKIDILSESITKFEINEKINKLNTHIKNYKIRLIPPEDERQKEEKQKEERQKEENRFEKTYVSTIILSMSSVMSIVKLNNLTSHIKHISGCRECRNNDKFKTDVSVVVLLIAPSILCYKLFKYLYKKNKPNIGYFYTQ